MTGLELLCAALPGHDAFVIRVVRYLAGEVGVRQFLDLGSGIAGGPMLHDVAQQVIPTARILYVTQHADVLARIDEHEHQASRGPVEGVKADRTDPAAFLDAAGATLDLTEPVAVVLTGVLHLAGDAEVDGLVSTLVDLVVTESHIVFSHLTRDIHPREMDAIGRELNDTTPETWTFRSFDQVRGLFSGLDLVDPGVVGVDEWRPAMNPKPPLIADGWTSPLWAGVGRKP